MLRYTATMPSLGYSGARTVDLLGMYLEHGHDLHPSREASDSPVCSKKNRRCKTYKGAEG